MSTIRRFAEDPQLADKPIENWDAAALIKLMWETWNDVFRDTFGFTERSLVSELRANCTIRAICQPAASRLSSPSPRRSPKP